MDCQEIFINGYEDILGALEHTLSGLTNDELNWQPKNDCNSIGWLAWHLTRVEDNQIASMMGEEALWTKQGWHTKFNRRADSKDVGFGHSSKQVAAFKSPDSGTLVDYNRAVFERARDCFLSMSAADWEQPLDEYWQGIPVKISWRLLSILEDCLQHTGQMAYLRGLRQGKGWQQY